MHTAKVRGGGPVLLALVALVTASPLAAQPDAVQRAEIALRAGGSVYEARVRLDSLLAGTPDDAAARLARARVLLRLGRPSAALADARFAADALGDDGLALLAWMEAARLSGRDAQARQAGERAAALALTGAALHVRLAWNARLLERLDLAEAFARIAVNQDPQHGPAYAELARAFERQGQLDAAASVLVRGLANRALGPPAFAPNAPLARWTDHPEVARALR